LKAVIKTYQSEVLKTLCLNITVCILNLCSPLFIFKLMSYVQAEPACPLEHNHAWCNIEEGVYWSLGLCLTQLGAYLTQEHMLFQQYMIGFKSANLVNMIVYKKHARISSATNKQFAQG
jgi:hypothetical protein